MLRNLSSMHSMELESFQLNSCYIRRSVDGELFDCSTLLLTLLTLVCILVVKNVWFHESFESLFQTRDVLDLEHEVHEMVESITLMMAFHASNLTSKVSSKYSIESSSFLGSSIKFDVVSFRFESCNSCLTHVVNCVSQVLVSILLSPKFEVLSNGSEFLRKIKRLDNSSLGRRVTFSHVQSKNASKTESVALSLRVAVLLIDKVVNKWSTVCQALKDRVHEASIPEVLKPWSN